MSCCYTATHSSFVFQLHTSNLTPHTSHDAPHTHICCTQFLGYGCALLGMLGWLGTAALPIASSCLPGLSHLDISGSGGLLPVGGEGGGRMGSGRGLRKSGSFGVGRALSRAAGALGLPLRVALLVGLGFCALGTWGLLDAAGNEVAQVRGGGGGCWVGRLDGFLRLSLTDPVQSGWSTRTQSVVVVVGEVS